MADCLHKVLDKIISPEQAAHDNVHLLEETNEYTHQNLIIPGLLLFLDFEKGIRLLSVELNSQCFAKIWFGRNVKKLD